ncbi:hypothetical protein [Tissierella praeacuta]|uniref:hypothetical protein n=1 Tax=Tissierella praeacuta TaxID=43131 RepID=UPI001C0F9C0F|nr:hypothetical protein [Tissierella praeacuta]MBU5257576.1 hypothetical protein [Tissierella praeacuta]
MEEIMLSARYKKFEKFEDVNEIDSDFIEIILFKMKEEIGFSLKTVAKSEKMIDAEPLVAIKALIEYREKEFAISIERTTYDNAFFLNISINVNKEEELFDILYEFKVEVIIFFKKHLGEVYYLQDTNNQKICTELYKEIHDVENDFRQLITLFYMRKIGQYDLPKPLRENAKDYSAWYNSKYCNSPFKTIESPLFNLTTERLFEVLERHLFELESVEKESLIEAIDKLDELLEDLNWASEFTINTMKLNDFRKKFEREFKKFKNKTIFEIYFKNSLREDFKEKWGEFSKMRNMVAHNKPICKELYDDILETCYELTERIKSAKYDMDKFVPEEVSMVDALYEQQQEELEAEAYEIEYQREVSGLDPVWEEYMVIEMLEENKEVQNLISIINCYGTVYRLMEYYDEVYYRFEEQVSQLDIDIVINLKRNVEEELDIGTEIENYSAEEDILHDTKALIMDALKFNLLDNENIYSDIDDSKYLDYFTIDEDLADLRDLKGNRYRVYVYGTINPDHNYEEDIEIRLTKNGSVIKRGYISINYGGFDFYDYGESQAENPIEGEITTRLESFNDEVKSIIQEIIVSLKEKVDKIEKIESFIKKYD